MLNLHTILPLVSAVFVTLLGVFVLMKNIRSPLNRLFFAFCLAMFFWLFGTFMMFLNRDNDLTAIRWDRFVYLGVTLMPALMHHFSLVFTGNRGQRRLLIFTYLGSLIFLVLSRTPYFVDGLYKYAWGVHTQARLFHHIFLIFFYYGVQVFIINIWRYYKKTEDREAKKQALYVVLAFSIVMFVGGTAYLTAYGIDIRYPFSYLSGLVFPFILAYAITKHHLLGAKVIQTEIIVGTVLFVLAAQLFTSTSITQIISRSLFILLIAVLGLMLIKSVITEVSRREEVQKLAAELQTANARLRELDRIKSEFLGIAAHQLRTPLSIIKGYLSMILEGDYGQVPPAVAKSLENAYNSNEHLVHLVNDFLDVTRIETGKDRFNFALASLETLLKEVVDEVKDRAAAKKLKLKVKTGQTPRVKIDREKIRHVIFNFIDNAMNYTPKGEIAVTLKMSPDDRFVVLTVKDTGIGIGPDDLKNLFQKFYRGQNARAVNVNGTGLGLFVCRQFIEAHQGEIWAESPGIGRGSTFGFRLPAI